MSYTRAKDPLARRRNSLIAKSNGAAPGGSLFPTGLPLSTANLYSEVQPRGSLYGLQHSNSVGIADRRDTADGIAGGRAHEISIGPCQRCAYFLGNFGFAHAIVATCDDKDGTCNGSATAS